MALVVAVNKLLPVLLEISLGLEGVLDIHIEVLHLGIGGPIIPVDVDVLLAFVWGVVHLRHLDSGAISELKEQDGRK